MTKNNKLKNFKTLRQQAENLSFSTVSRRRDLSNINVEELIYELDVHQIELQMQNDELQHALFQLEASQSRYFGLYEFAPVGYLSLDGNTRIVEANRTIGDLLGIAKTKLINKRFTDFINEKHQDDFFLLCRKSSLTQDKQSCELKLIRKSDIPLYVHIESLVIGNVSISSHHLFLSITDITTKKLAEEQFRQHQFELNQMAKLNALNNKFIKISVSDIGPGIAAKTAEKLFKPFFTTKSNGLGVGLAMCQNIISAYGGELYAKNDHKKGACFEFTFPLAEPVL